MIKLMNVSKIYKNKLVETPALKEINLCIEDGEFVAIVGTSGSGKTTLLNIIGGMDSLTDGTYIFDELDIGNMKNHELYEFRKNNVSFVFQHFELMNHYTVYENVEMPLLARNFKKKDIKYLVEEKLKMLEIWDLKDKLPIYLSGGQQQRVAIARALVTDSKLILADEPTGALDKQNGQNLMQIFRNIHSSGKTIIIITHDSQIAKQCDRIIEISDGVILNS